MYPERSLLLPTETSVSVVDNGITSVQLANDAVQNINISDGAVGTSKLQSLSVENGNLAGNITGDKLEDNTLTSNLYGHQSIPSSAYQLRSVQRYQKPCGFTLFFNNSIHDTEHCFAYF